MQPGQSETPLTQELTRQPSEAREIERQRAIARARNVFAKLMLVAREDADALSSTRDGHIPLLRVGRAFAHPSILARGPRGPLIVERTDGDALHVALLFHTDRSTLPYRVGFPIFVSNVVHATLSHSPPSPAPIPYAPTSPRSPCARARMRPRSLTSPFTARARACSK